ncbi:Zn(2)-C6 fungal-type domain-containing protein [Trichoderma simmonsii]|uniref:Zn(2)-C6 fungal-type domain-containing protein n=1 Tax=Trichoderma simmonsii TaxID=1491479 RepID=A0A8G0LIJ5_9HYPO|nr:Zn(2)-C6 fungal-type domain-containing protein [Trichoderma simmonsii]
MDESATPQRFKYSCTECQRRKQKCNKIFPCVHCKSRGVQRNCIFKEKPAKPANPPPQASSATTSKTTAGVGASKKRYRGSSEDSNSESDSDADTGNGGFDSVGQKGVAVDSGNPGPLVLEQSGGQLTQLSPNTQTRQPRPRRNKQYSISAAACTELRTALAIIPEDRNHLDTLILSFFQNVNPHYGMIHKTDFSREYNRWWKKRSRNQPLPIPWTCLLLMMCACACQHLPVDIQKKLAKMLGPSCQECTESFHYTARYLYSAIPPGHYHKNNVLWLLHSTYWYKAEAMFVETCHVFYTAVREAQELGFDTERDVNDVPNFELEIRRRAWCVIDSWDWQIASGLSRDTLVDHSMCNAKRPSLTLEPDGEFSPLMHMNMQSDLIHKLAGRFPCPAQIKSRSDVMEYKGMIDEWMQNFPPIFALTNPDTSNDKKQAWIEYHRHYNYTMGYMMVLNPFRPHMALPYTDKSSAEELELRRIAVDLTLLLVQVLDNWLKFLTFRDGRFHFIIFSLVDAATVMSNMVLNDKAQTLPRRDDVYRAIKTTLVLQRKLYFLSASAKLGFRIVQRIVRHLFRSTPTEYLDSLENGSHDDTNNDNTQPVLSAAPDQASSGALMNVQNIDPEVPVSSRLWWDLPATEVPAPASDAGTGSQLATYADYGTLSYNNGVTVGPDGKMDNISPHTISKDQANTSSQDTLAISATFGSTEPTASTTDTEPASVDYPSSTSLPSVSSASPSYVTALTPESTAGTAAHVESTLSGPAPISPSVYVSAASPSVVTAPPLGPITSASPNYIATTPVYFGPVPTGQVSDAPLSNIADSSLPLAHTINESLPWSNIVDASFPLNNDAGMSLPLNNMHGVPLNGPLDYSAFYAAGASPAYNATMPAYIDPAFLSTLSPSRASEYMLTTSVPNVGPNTGLTPTSISPIFPDTTTFDTSTPHLPWPDYNDAGRNTTPKSHGASIGYDIAAPFNVPSTYATPAPYSSPEGHASAEHSLNPPTGYDTPSSVFFTTTNTTSDIYTSPSEGFASPENHGAPGDHTSSTSAETALLYSDEDYNAHTVSTVYETPESYHTAPSYATPKDNSRSPDVQPPV